MKKVIFSSIIFFIMIVGVFADSDVGNDITQKAVEGVAKKGINAEKIKNISKVNLKRPPKEIIVENVEDTNVAVYEVDYGENNSIFMVVGSGSEIKGIPSVTKFRQFLSFGFAGSSNGSRFLRTATGVETGMSEGYVMMREGSVTGISTNLNTVKGKGQIKIVVYKNGEAIGFGNKFIVSSEGIGRDYDIQSEGVATFEPGDVISVYVKTDKDAVWKDVITMIEVVTV